MSEVPPGGSSERRASRWQEEQGNTEAVAVAAPTASNVVARAELFGQALYYGSGGDGVGGGRWGRSWGWGGGQGHAGVGVVDGAGVGTGFWVGDGVGGLGWGIGLGSGWGTGLALGLGRGSGWDVGHVLLGWMGGQGWDQWAGGRVRVWELCSRR